MWPPRPSYSGHALPADEQPYWWWYESAHWVSQRDREALGLTLEALDAAYRLGGPTAVGAMVNTKLSAIRVFNLDIDERSWNGTSGGIAWYIARRNERDAAQGG